MEFTENNHSCIIVNIDTLPENKNCGEILAKIIDTGRSFLTDISNPVVTFEWAIFEICIVNLVEEHDALHQLANSIHYQAKNIIECLHNITTTPEITFALIQSINKMHIESFKEEFKTTIFNSFSLDSLLENIQHDERNYRQLQPRHQPIDMFDDEFGQANNSTDNSSRASSKLLNCVNLAYEEVKVIEILKGYFTRNLLQETDISETFYLAAQYLETLNSLDVLYGIFYLCNEMDTVRNQLIEVSSSCWTKLVRILGEGPLTDVDLERNELAIITVSNLLTLLFPIWHNTPDEGFRKDCSDMLSWLVQCGSKNLITTEASSSAFLEFMITYLTYNEKSSANNLNVQSIFMRVFASSANNIKIQIIPPLLKYLESKPVADQMMVYKELFQNFESPQQSIEKCGTFCLFFSILSSASMQILMAVLFNFMEYARFDFFLTYLKEALSCIFKRIKLKSSKDLFMLFKFEILKSWWSYDIDIEDFPFELFGYDSRASFLLSNYKELVAISISTKTNDSISNYDLLELISSVKGVDINSLIVDSLTLSIPLAYTREGIRNSIYGKLSDALNDQYRFQIKEKLFTLIFEVIKLIDMSNERLLRDLGQIKEVTLQLIANDSLILENPGLVSISLYSGLDLIKGLVDKYSSNPATFWHPNILYFLSRNTLRLFHNSVHKDQKRLCLRKLKLIIILGGRNLFLPALANLIISSLAPSLADRDLHEDIARILSVFRVHEFNNFDESEFLQLTIKLISSLFEVDFELFQVHPVLFEIIQEYVKFSTKRRKVHLILEASINILQSKPIHLTTSDIELFLNAEDELELCKFGMNAKHMLKLISQIFIYIETYDALGSHENVVLLLLNEYDIGLEHSREFSLWSAEYLANYYLNGGFKHNVSGIIRKNNRNIQNTFETDISSMDNILDNIIRYLNSDYLETASCAESILSVLIWKVKTKKSDVQKFLNFDKYYDKYILYIIPIDFHSCVLLNSTDELTSQGYLLQEIISDLAQSVQTTLFESWASRIFLAVAQDLAKATSIAPLFSIFATKVETFSKDVLPGFICYYINIMGKGAVSQIIDFLSTFSMLKSYKSEYVDLVLQIILKIRIGAKKQIQLFVDVYLNLDLDRYFRIAANHQFYSTALMLLEDSYSDSDKAVDWRSHSNILSKIYESIDNEDLIFGLPEETSLEYAVRMINRSNETSDHLKFSSGIFDTNISFNMESTNTNILSTMIHNGFLGVSKLVSKTLDNNGTSNGTFEWAWKLNCWDIPSPNEAREDHKSIYKTLKKIHDYPISANETSRESILEILSIKNTIINTASSPKELRLNMERWFNTLACISSIKQVLSYTDANYCDLQVNFTRQTGWFELADVDKSENILLARKAAFQIIDGSSVYSKQISSENLWLCALNDLIRFNSISITAKEQQKLINSIMMINEISKTKFTKSNNQLINNIDRLSKYQIARCLWHLGQTNIPVNMLKELKEEENINLSIGNLNITPSLINANLVDWMAVSRQDLASNIMEKYVLPTADMVSSVKQLDQKAKVYEILANFCETQYKSRNIDDQISKLEKLVDLKKSEIEELKAHYSKMPVAADEKRSAQRYYSKLKAQYVGEVSDLNSLKMNINEFSNKAVEFYLKSILTDNDNDENLDKFFALWLEHSNKDELHAIVSDDVLSLPSHKLVSWSTQLISRLSSDSTKFQSLLKSLIVSLCYDHPYHSLYGLMSLRKHESYAKKSSNMLLISKSVAANNIWEQLITKGDNRTQTILQGIERFCDESVKLAEHKVSRGKLVHLDSLNIGDYWLHELPTIPPPTKNLSLDLSMEYNKVACFVSIVPKVSIATSGLSLPKIATFCLSDGSEHKILFKHGTDDLRQDSIMEQVFEKVNNIFKKDKETRKRRLRVRTYRAVPLGPETGIIEFVPNSIAIIDVIKPYHTKMDKLKPEKARDMMKSCQSEEKGERYRAYEKVSSKIHPVLRYFFFDNYPMPDTWIDCRTSYTRGIATTSIVGHILGLGDRHCNNILLDKNSGEPIHIDLGVAFDQGKRLPIPETVPFRLTRDIVDGFGITGVNGVFNKSCEHTYRVLRQNRQHILAILDVLRWDPLYSWSLSPIRRKRLQNEGGKHEVGYLKPQEDGSEGGRAVLMVSDKLTAGGLNVEAIVRELIQEATNPQNLALIYCGWCPFY